MLKYKLFINNLYYNISKSFRDFMPCIVLVSHVAVFEEKDDNVR